MVAKLLGRGNKENPIQNLCPPPSRELGPLWLAGSQGTNDWELHSGTIRNHPLKLAYFLAGWVYLGPNGLTCHERVVVDKMIK